MQYLKSKPRFILNKNRNQYFNKIFLINLLLALFLSFTFHAYCQTRDEGYYKEIFMDGGVNLTSRTTLPAADNLGLSMEYIATDNKTIQSSVIISNMHDDNGVLLYPDGEPRYKLLYTNGGSATSHGRSLGEPGRNIVRTFFRNGGSYSGSCAGAFICSLNFTDSEDLKEEYYHIWPGYALKTSQKKIYTGHVIPDNSPLLQYYDFGEDHYVSNVYHNGGCFGYEPKMPEGTEILARYDYPASDLMHNKVSVWAYKDLNDQESGRLVVIGSHPEGITSGERLDLMSAIFQYAIDGNGEIKIKGELNNGEKRIMDLSTGDNNPAYTKIGDKQYHHFTVDIPEGTWKLTVKITGDDNYDLSVYVNRDEFAFNSNALFKDKSEGANKSLIIDDLNAGKYYISVECETTVTSLNHSEYYEYTGNLDVLNGVAYTIQADWAVSTDINQVNINDIVIYPNPFSSIINIRMNNNLPIDEITILDQSGNSVYNQKTGNYSSNIIIDQCSDLPSGSYYLRIRSKDKIYVKKLIKISN